MNGPDYAARAAAGARFLDGKLPGWAGRIDLEQLDMSNCHRCILGQLAGRYDDALDDFGISGADDIQLGFMTMAGAWRELSEAWAGEITRRREPAQVTA